MRYRVWRLGKLVVFVVAAAAIGGVVMLLWNAVIPTVFAGGRPIDYLHAVALLVLSRILFGGFRGGGGWRRRDHWRRWEAMTPEERDQLSQSFSARCRKREQQT
jgi:hypothetical protein